MKSTCKLGPVKGVDVILAGTRVKIDLTTFGVSALSETLETDQAMVIGEALIRTAIRAELNKSGAPAL